MEQIQNHKSVDSQPIWLKSVRSEADSLDLTNPWLKEVIKSNPELIFSILYGEFRLPLSSTRFGSSGWVLVDASVNRLRCQSDQLSDWQLHSVRLRSGSVRHRSGIDGLSISIFGLSPWDLRPPGLDLIFCIYLGTTSSSKLVRTGIEVLLLFDCCNSSFEIKKIFGGNMVWCHYMCGWLLPLFYWGNLYLWSFLAIFLVDLWLRLVISLLQSW